MLRKIYKSLFKNEIKEIENEIAPDIQWNSIDYFIESMKSQLNKMIYISGNNSKEKIINLKKDKEIYLKFLKLQEKLEFLLELDLESDHDKENPI